MSESLRNYAADTSRVRPGDLALVAHPDGGYVFAVADNPPDYVVWGDVRMLTDRIHGMLFAKPPETERAAGLLIGRRFKTPEAAVAAVRPYEIGGGA